MEYLGHVVRNKGVIEDQIKIKAMLEWPTLNSIKGLRAFLGLASYYWKFIKDYGKIAKPLMDLLKKGSIWMEC